MVTLPVLGATEYDVFPLATPPNPTTLPVPADGVIALDLAWSAPPEKAETLELFLTAFADAQGRPARVVVLLPGELVEQAAGLPNPRSVSMNQAVMPLRLRVSGLASPAGASGRFVIGRAGTRLRTYPLTLKGQVPELAAKLKLDRRTVTVNVVNRLFPAPDDPPSTFALTLRDDGGSWPLQGVHARLEESGGPEDAFSPLRDIRFEMNGARTEFWQLQDTRDRTVPTGAQATLQGTLERLPPGQHTAKIRVTAANSQPDAGQLLDLKVNVRRSLSTAILILLLGIAVSLVTTVVLKSRAAMLRLRLRILQSRPMWLADEPSSLIVTWVRSIYGQAATLRQHFTVAATDLLEERVTQATQHLRYLGQIAHIRRSIERGPLPHMARRRGNKVLQLIVGRLQPGAVDDATGLSIQRDIDELNGWLDDKWESPYWKSLKRDVDALRRVVDVTAFTSDVKPTIEGLLTDIGVETQPLTTQSLVDLENRYAALKLAWERVGDARQVKELMDSWGARRRIDDLFIRADKGVWERLKARQDQLYLVVSARSVSPEPHEPFQPIRFEVAATRDADVADTYLFKHNLDYEWRIAPLDGDHLPLEPTTREPVVVQYSPRKCTLQCSVTLRYGNETVVVKTGRDRKPFTVVVAGSSFKRLMRSIETTELISLGLAVVAGTASGLLTQYVGNATWGSAKDCLGLFIWGIGADQAAKSFVEVLGRFPRWQGASAAAPTAAAAPATLVAPTVAAGAGAAIVPKMAPPI